MSCSHCQLVISSNRPFLLEVSVGLSTAVRPKMSKMYQICSSFSVRRGQNFAMFCFHSYFKGLIVQIEKKVTAERPFIV